MTMEAIFALAIVIIIPGIGLIRLAFNV